MNSGKIAITAGPTLKAVITGVISCVVVSLVTDIGLHNSATVLLSKS